MDGMDFTSAAYEVGCETVSQFLRHRGIDFHVPSDPLADTVSQSRGSFRKKEPQSSSVIWHSLFVRCSMRDCVAVLQAVYTPRFDFSTYLLGHLFEN
jgi:hypothetical protein